MNEATRNLVRQRAGDRCEYCRVPQDAIDLRFHVEHIVAKQHRQDDDPSNLALACERCNLHKGTNLTSIDPDTEQVASLYHPRTDSWNDHFTLHGPEIVGITATGRATVKLFQMNAEPRLKLRMHLIDAGEF